MRGPTLAAALLLGACASSQVVLLPGENGAATGSVVLLDPKAETERTVISDANSAATLGGARPTVRRIDAARYEALAQTMPAAATSFTMYFLEGRTDLAPGSAPILTALKAEVARRPGAEVQITGHTDRVGQLRDNDELSRRRAEQIRAALVGSGELDAAITRAVGRGEREPLVPTPDGADEPRNRRVEVIVR